MDKVIILILSLFIFGIALSSCLDVVYNKKNQLITKQESIIYFYDEAIQNANAINNGGN